MDCPKPWHAHAGAICAVAVVAAFGAAAAHAASFTVDSPLDAVDANVGDGACAAVGGVCTLRAAIQETNALPGDHQIALAAVTYTLTLAGGNDDAAASGDLDMRGAGHIALVGTGPATTVIDAGTLDRVLHIDKTGGSVTVDGIGLTNGRVVGNGAGLLNINARVTLRNVNISNNGALTLTDADGTHYGIGGGILNGPAGIMVLDNAYVGRNAASNSLAYYDWPSQSLTGGGGIRNQGVMDIRASRIEDNEGEQFGAGINNTGTLTMSDSVVQFNGVASGPTGGGGIANMGGVLELRRSVVSDNLAVASGGGLYNYTGSSPERGSSPGIAVVIESAVDNNTAVLSVGGGIANYSVMYIGYSSVSWNRITGGYGAGINNDSLGELTLENSTLVGNHHTTLGGHGGGLSTSRGVTLNHVTIAGNYAQGGLGNEIFVNTSDFRVDEPSEWLNITNSVIGDDAYLKSLLPPQVAAALIGNNQCGGGYNAATLPDVTGQPPTLTPTTDYLSLVHSGGYNIEDGNACGLTAIGDRVMTPPALEPAAESGGPALPTGPFLATAVARAPAVGSAAIDAIPAQRCAPAFDQRVLGRPAGAACDAGAVEVAAAAVPYADLSVSAQATPQWLVTAGQDIVYTLTIANHGNAAATALGGAGSSITTGFKLHNVAVIGVTYTAPAGGVVSCTAGALATVNCSYNAPLDPGQTLTLYVTVAPPLQGSRVYAEAVVSVASPADPVRFNNKATWEHQVVEAHVADTGFGAGALDPRALALLLLLWRLRRPSSLKRITSHRARFVFACLFGAWHASSQAVPPTISGVSPASVAAAADTVITITGTNFDANARVALLSDPNVSAVSAALGTPSENLVIKQGNLAYVALPGASSAGTFTVYDVTNPHAPALLSSQSPEVQLPIGTLPDASNNGGMWGYALRNDNRVFVSLYEGITLWDYSVPTTPVLDKRMRGLTLKNGLHPDLSSGQPNPFRFSMAVDGDLVYIARNEHARTIYDMPGLYIVDTAKARAPHILGYTYFDAVGRLRLGRVGSALYAYVLSERALKIVDVTVPAQPVVLAIYTGPLNASNLPEAIFDFDIVMSATTVTAIAAAANGLLIFDLSPASGYTNTAPIGRYDLPVGANQSYAYPTLIKVQGNNAIVHTPTGNFPAVPHNVYWHFDISDARAPTLAGGPYADDAYPWSLDYDAGYIYGGSHILKLNPPLTNITITPTTITATVPAGYRPETYGVIVTNPAGQGEEARLAGGLVVQ